MIADLATRDGRRVRHIMPNGSLASHRLSDLTGRLADRQAQLGCLLWARRE